MLSPPLLLLLLAACAAHAHAHTDADGYETFTRTANGSLLNAYKLHAARATWDAASGACAREDAHLLVIDSPDEARVARTLFARVPAAGAKQLDQLHVGILDRAQEGVWKTVLGAPLTTTNGPVAWAASQPDNAGGAEHCGAITRDVLYNDLVCDSSHLCPFICEKELAKGVGVGVETVDYEASLGDLLGGVDVRIQGQAYKPRFLAILLRL